MIPHTIIKDYLYEKFPNNKVSGKEFITDSIFREDDKKHLSINMDTGLWQDFKAHETGNFPQLISQVEQISYNEASMFLRRKMFDTPECLFDVSNIRVENEALENNDTLNKIFSTFEPFDSYNLKNPTLTEKLARNFVQGRKLQKTKLYIAKKGRYANRIVIPYETPQGPFYFQARNLSLLGIKYLNPSKDITGIKSSDIVYPFQADCDYVFLTEGPIDAISLQLNGINATCTQGSMLSHSQANQIKDKKIIFAYDNDEAGRAGMINAKRLMLNKNVNDFGIATLPGSLKDWNELHVKCNKSSDFRKAVRANMHELNFEFEVISALQ